MNNYIEEACKTVSPHFYGKNVSLHQFANCISYCIEGLKELDAIKKALFYGKPNEILEQPQNALTCDCLAFEMPQDFIDVIHGILGIATEAGEMLEAMHKSFTESAINCQFDLVNLKEEGGDSLWYHALLFRAIGTNFDEVQHLNIEKLQKKRYKNAQFTNEAAIVRDLDGERKLLEATAQYNAKIQSGELVSESTDAEFVKQAKECFASGHVETNITENKTIGAFDPLPINPTTDAV